MYLNSLLGIIYNIPLRAAFFGWFIAQLLKVPIYYYVDGVLDWKRFFGSGGMPSSHSSSIIAATTSIGMSAGFDSSVFAIALVISVIVMYDAAGVRRAAGKHAAVLNEILEMFNKDEEITDEKLKELIGHTPVEVFVGAWLGVLVGVIVTLASLAITKVH